MDNYKTIYNGLRGGYSVKYKDRCHTFFRVKVYMSGYNIEEIRKMIYYFVK